MIAREERTVLATVRGNSDRLVLNLGGFRNWLYNNVMIRPNTIIAMSAVGSLISFSVMVLLGRAGVDHHAGIDYQVYRWAVRAWLSGNDVLGGAPTTSTGQVLPWVYPPFALVLLAPLGMAPFLVGLFALYLLNFASLGTVLYLVVRHLWPEVGRRGALAVASAILPLTLFLEPVYASFGLGQINILLMGLVAVDCLARRPQWPRGLLVGIAAAVKLTPAAFLLFFLLRKDFRASLTAGCTAVAGTLIGFAIEFPASMAYWFRRGPAQGVSGSSFHTNQSIMGGLARWDLSAVVQGCAWVILCLLVVAVVVSMLGRLDPPTALLTTALLALLISPTSWSDHWVWVAPGLLLMYGYAARLRSPGRLTVAIVANVTVMLATFRMTGKLPWTPVEHFLGNSYLLLGVAFLLLLRRYGVRGGIGHDDVPGESVVAKPVIATTSH